MMRARQLPRAGAACLALLLGGPALAGRAAAAVLPAQVVDGPSGDILEVGGTAMASDGTGGLVYLKRVNGHSHVFVSRYTHRRWQAPVEVDGDLPYDSAWPRIAAGRDGRLVVVFSHTWEQGNQWLFGAIMQPGAPSFSPAQQIDTALGGAAGLYPDVAMNDGGRAYVSYRVQQPGTATRAGDVVAETRVARLSGGHWSVIGQVNRRPGVSVAPTTAENAPKVAIDQQGNGIVAFQEPDDQLIDRIWARRLFGAVPGRILPVSPATWNGQPLRGPADALSVSSAGFGVAAVAFRQQPGPVSPLAGPRVMVNTLAIMTDDHAADFRGPQLADGAGAGALPGSPSLPGVAIDRQERLRVAFVAGGRTFESTGEAGVMSATGSLTAPRGVGAGATSLALAPGGALAAAWPLTLGSGAGATAVQEAPAHGASAVGVLSAPIGGPVNGVALGGSAVGDALVGFLQGTGPDAQVVAAAVDAPPAGFAVTAPDGWVRPPYERIKWEAAADTTEGGVTYTPVVDGARVALSLRSRRYRFDRRRLGDGRHTVTVIARDGRGQTTTSQPATLRVDGTPPVATATVRGRRLRVTVSDGPRSRASGVQGGHTSVSFGDGARTRRRGTRVRHVYRRRGRFVVVVHARDRAGNPAVERLRVRVR